MARLQAVGGSLARRCDAKGADSGPGTTRRSGIGATMEHESGRVKSQAKKKGAARPHCVPSHYYEANCVAEKNQAAATGSAPERWLTGADVSIAPLPMVMPIRRAHMVPPAKRANSES
jgi:hypothetical protein